MTLDSKTIDWSSVELPDAWPDDWQFSKPSHVFEFLRYVFRPKHAQVKLPDALPGKEKIPKYLLQEFHNLPNGNFSKQISKGYLTGFDHAMLGHMKSARALLSHTLRSCKKTLDLGCGGGHLAAAMHAEGIAEVWALDPSPYLLQHAAVSYPDINFQQGVAEHLEFDNDSFDGMGASFLFHELPPKYADAAVAEIARCTRTGGLVAICEPSEKQLTHSWWSIFKHHGPKGLYFKTLARTVHEPFLQAWLKWDLEAAFIAHGFELVELEEQFPIQFYSFRKL